MTTYLGKVSYDLDPSHRVRVALFGAEGVPQLVWAGLGAHSRSLFKKGVTVELYSDREYRVGRTQRDKAEFRVTKVFEEVQKKKEEPITVHCDFNVTVPSPEAFGYEPKRKKPFEVHPSYIYVPGADAFNREQATIMEQLGDRVTVLHEDRVVRFWISSRYSKDEATQLAMYRVLVSALSMEENEANGLLTQETGFRVTCRESQFARFLIKRNEEGLPNLFQDLRVDYRTAGNKLPEINVSRR